MKGVWAVTIEWPEAEGGDRKRRTIAISDVLVQSTYIRPRPARGDVADQVAALRIAECEVWRDA